MAYSTTRQRPHNTENRKTHDRNTLQETVRKFRFVVDPQPAITAILGTRTPFKARAATSLTATTRSRSRKARSRLPPQLQTERTPKGRVGTW